MGMLSRRMWEVRGIMLILVVNILSVFENEVSKGYYKNLRNEISREEMKAFFG